MSSRIRRVTFVLITLAGSALIAWGLHAHQADAVLRNARLLCLSCMGIQ